MVTIPSAEALAVKVRYKLPGEERSRLIQEELIDSGTEELTGDFAFAAAVAMLRAAAAALGLPRHGELGRGDPAGAIRPCE